MNFEHAEHTLETIRTLMERSQRYEHISGASGLVAGSAVLAGCGVLGFGLMPFNPGTNFVMVWTSVLLVACAAHCALTSARAHKRGEQAWSRQARTVLLAVLPCFLASVSISVLMARLNRLDLLPALWLLLYGCGVLATSFFAPRSILRLGLSCLTMGTISAVVVPGWPILTMAVGFGMTHLCFGACVAVSEWKEQRERKEWMPWEQNPVN